MLALLDELNLTTTTPFHATRPDLLRRLGRNNEAAAYKRAADMAPTRSERGADSAAGREADRPE